MRRSIVNLLCLFVPSKNARYRIRKKLVGKSRVEKLESAVNMLYFILENCVGASNMPKAVGDLRTTQEKSIDLLKFFDVLCAKHGLRYWLDFGTLLGAVRHKGFIPWDDDLDVGMMRSDYERLFDVLESELRGTEYSSLIMKDKPRKILLKIISKNGLAQLDIFPYDFYYKNIENDADIVAFYKNLNSGYDEYLKNFGYKIAAGKISYSSADVGNVVKKYILDGNEVLLESKPSIFFGIEFYHAWSNKFFDFDDIFPLKKLEFEGVEFSVPNDFDKHLKLIYGDYMKIPRETHIHEKLEKM